MTRDWTELGEEEALAHFETRCVADAAREGPWIVWAFTDGTRLRFDPEPLLKGFAGPAGLWQVDPRE